MSHSQVHFFPAWSLTWICGKCNMHLANRVRAGWQSVYKPASAPLGAAPSAFTACYSAYTCVLVRLAGVAHMCVFMHAQSNHCRQASFCSFFPSAVLPFPPSLFWDAHACCDPARADSVRFSLGLGGSQRYTPFSKFKMMKSEESVLRPFAAVRLGADTV